MPNNMQAAHSIDPRWTARIYKTDTGEDFLGLRAVQANMTDYLLPGIITLTSRARYYAFYSWLLVEYAEAHPKGWSLPKFMRKREQIFALANLAQADVGDDDPGVAGLTGWRRLNHHWKTYRTAARIPLDTAEATNYVQARYGGYDYYAGVMRALQITRQLGPGQDQLGVEPKGQRLAQAFAAAIRGTKYYRRRARYDLASSIPCTVLLEYGKRCHLTYLAQSADRKPTWDALLALDAPAVLPPIASDSPILGNMRGTLGLLLEILDQAPGPCSEDDLRQAVAYGLCDDYAAYRPSRQLAAFLAHWRMFQLREYYVYALYAVWAYFLHWLRVSGPETLEGFLTDLESTVVLADTGKAVGLQLPQRQAEGCRIREWLDILLDAADVPGRDSAARCMVFAQQSSAALNEHRLYLALAGASTDNATAYFGTAWLLLCALYLRLRGLQALEQQGAWAWAGHGGARRRSLQLFTDDMSHLLAGEATVLDGWRWLCRDYIIAQHTLSALEKWRQRQANTFHFGYDAGVFSWIRDDTTGFIGSRFPQARDMLRDLGLWHSEPDGRPCLSDEGRRTLQQILESCSG
jgi:hypothetical protein